MIELAIGLIEESGEEIVRCENCKHMIEKRLVFFGQHADGCIN